MVQDIPCTAVFTINLDADTHSMTRGVIFLSCARRDIDRYSLWSNLVVVDDEKKAELEVWIQKIGLYPVIVARFVPVEYNPHIPEPTQLH